MTGSGPTRIFLAVATIDRFAALKRMIGYSHANSVLDILCADVRPLFADGEVTRCGRSAIELTFWAASRDEAMGRIEQLRGAVNREMVIEGYRFEQSLVVALADSGGSPITDELVDSAEAALAEAIERRLSVIEAQLQASPDVVDRFTLMRDLQRAIAEDDLELHYQPKLRSRTGLVDSAEGLLRWTHKTRGPMSAELVVRMAEETGNIRALTIWTIERAIADQAWLRAQGSDLRLHINLSGALIHDAPFADWLLGRLRETGATIGFEITETATIADPQGALAHLNALADAGVHLSIDDYGSGYSSLAYIQSLPVNELKIDRSFITRLRSSQRDPLLVRSTIDLAHALDMEVTAEGVDTPEALALLQVMGCDLIQGYLLSRPIPLADFQAFVVRNRENGGATERSAGMDRLRRLRSGTGNRT
jgi:EAL domain-containing protein (putative c-di-GMP-specific phosphodiesterase class I)/GGDEF domain-containing protein